MAACTTFYQADCLVQLRKLPAASVDFIYFNPPFGITHQPWDERLDWPAIFAELFRIVKSPGTIAIHASVPFNYTLIREAPRAPSYSWYWDKINTTTPLLAKKQPMRRVEEILVWTNRVKYHPQRVGDELRQETSGAVSSAYMGSVRHRPVIYREVRGRLQTHLITQKPHIRGFATRPDDLIELFIKSYTDAGDTVLDPTCYQGLSGVVAKRLGRNWIGIDKHFLPGLLMGAAPGR